MSDEFYVGYLPGPRPLTRRFVARVALALGAVLTLAVALLAACQAPVGDGRFEFGEWRDFEGILFEDPVPFLHRIGGDPSGTAGSDLLVVGLGKQGLPAFARGHDGRRVSFRGTLIENRGRRMVELSDPASFRVLDEERRPRPPVAELGRVSLAGELVDTKCYLGVMRPATGKVHRACAARCLSGGVPPGLLVREGGEAARVILLAGSDGSPWRVTPDWAARRLSVSGSMRLVGDLPVLTVGEWRLVEE